MEQTHRGLERCEISTAIPANLGVEFHRISLNLVEPTIDIGRHQPFYSMTFALVLPTKHFQTFSNVPSLLKTEFRGQKFPLLE